MISRLTRILRKEPIEVKVVSATIVNKKEDCESVEFENEYFEEDSKIMINKVVVEEESMESREQKLQSEEEVWEMHGDFDNTPKDFPHETINNSFSK